MTRRRRFLVFLTLVVLCATHLYARRGRLAAVPSDAPVSWLSRHAIPLTTDQFDGSSDDLRPLLPLIADASIIGLGDGTHGTGEYFTVKHRIIDLLVREHAVELVVFEAPWPEFRIINAYIRGDDIELRATNFGETYPFWRTEEMFAFFEWAREVNESAGRQVIEIAGVDPWVHWSAADDVIAFLQPLDPAAAASATAAYSCISRTQISMYSFKPDDVKLACRTGISAVLADLDARSSMFSAASSPERFLDVRASAEMVRQAEEIWRIPTQGYGTARLSMRDRQMANNVRALSANGTRRTVVWGHNEHVGQDHLEIFGREDLALETTSMGALLSEWYGDRYFVIGTAFQYGSFNTFSGTKAIPWKMPDPGPDNIETILGWAGMPRMIVPLRGVLPPWLAARHRLRLGQTSFVSDPDVYNPWMLNLARKYDALLFLRDADASLYSPP